MGVRTGCQVHRYTGTVQYRTATATATTTATVTATTLCGGFGPLGIEVEKQSFRRAWLITGKKFQVFGLKWPQMGPGVFFPY